MLLLQRLLLVFAPSGLCDLTPVRLLTALRSPPLLITISNPTFTGMMMSRVAVGCIVEDYIDKL